MATPSEVPKDKGLPFTFHRVLLKAKYSLYSALIFFLFANPETLRILHRILHRFIDIIGPSGLITTEGIFITTGLFFITMLGLMLLPSE
jgi:hypothetical protein